MKRRIIPTTIHSEINPSAADLLSRKSIWLQFLDEFDDFYEIYWASEVENGSHFGESLRILNLIEADRGFKRIFFIELFRQKAISAKVTCDKLNAASQKRLNTKEKQMKWLSLNIEGDFDPLEMKIYKKIKNQINRSQPALF